jgi:hypothetical protein
LGSQAASKRRLALSELQWTLTRWQSVRRVPGFGLACGTRAIDRCQRVNRTVAASIDADDSCEWSFANDDGTPSGGP